jgi:hypothetical protein
LITGQAVNEEAMCDLEFPDASNGLGASYAVDHQALPVVVQVML